MTDNDDAPRADPAGRLDPAAAAGAFDERTTNPQDPAQRPVSDPEGADAAEQLAQRGAEREGVSRPGAGDYNRG